MVARGFSNKAVFYALCGAAELNHEGVLAIQATAVKQAPWLCKASVKASGKRVTKPIKLEAHI
jgi:hypothetical protein